MTKLITSFWDDYPQVKGDLELIQDIMENNIKCKEVMTETALTDMINSGGKLLRPAFLMLTGRLGKFDPDKLAPLGAAVEMLHMATLVHDDVVDNSALRRGAETIQHKYGKRNAVLMGDFLFSRCFMLLSDKTSMKNMRMLSKVISRMCVGEIEQYSSRFYDNITVKRYLKRIAAKTAALFSLSFYIGASEGKCSQKLCKTAAKAGYYIGMAFQIIDDILDYVGDESTVGKSLGNDLNQGYFTLPLIYALRENTPGLRDIVCKTSYSGEDITQILALTRSSAGVDHARALAGRYTEKAFRQLSLLPDKESKAILISVTEKLLERKY